MLFGFANSSATFQYYINKYLTKKLDVFYILYLKDIFIYTKEKNFKNKEAVRQLLEQLQK